LALANIQANKEEQFDKCFHSTQILQSKYNKADVQTVAKQQTHLMPAQQGERQTVLSKHNKLFLGKLGHYHHKKMDLELLPGAKPIHSKPNPIPCIQCDIFQNELQYLVQLGILSGVGGTKWASPTFIIPKTDQTVLWVSNFCDLNKVICCKIYPLPLIQEILNKRPGYKYFTKIDISMQYDIFELTDLVKELCVVIMPFGKFRYERVLMGVKQSPNFAQEVMEDIIWDMTDVEVYIDDIGIFTQSWEHHQTIVS
jgi:hypothetical protein